MLFHIPQQYGFKEVSESQISLSKKYFDLYFINCSLSVRRKIFQMIVEGDINVIYTLGKIKTVCTDHF
jgi:hypothetical protein